MATRANNKHKTNDIPQSSPPLNHGQLPSTPSGLPWDPHKPLNHPGSSGLPERQVTLSKNTPPEGVKTPSVRLGKVPLYIQENIKDLPVGGRLKWFVEHWEKQGAHPFQLDLLRQGYRLPFRDHPKLSRTPCIHSEYNDTDKVNALSTSILDLLTKNAIEKVNKQDSLGFYSRLFLVTKPGNKWRPVIDLSSLNLTVSKFKMETPVSIRTSLRQGEWVTSIDLSDAYLHIPIHPQSRKFLRFHHKGTTYQFTSLPFGLATAPLVFTSLVKEVKLLALKQHIRLHQYLDDWLIRATSQPEAQEKTTKLLSLVRSLGFIVNLKKSELTPQQRFNFIGYHFALDQGLVKPTKDRWSKIQNTFNAIATRSTLSARTLMSIIRLLASTEKTVKLGRIRMRPFQWHLKSHWRAPMPLNSPIPWTHRMKQHGEWWLNPQNVLVGEFLHPRDHDILIFTDASNAGWGAHLNHDSVGGLWSQIEKRLHINVLELKAVILALQHFSHQCNKKQVLVASDNTTVVAHINKQGGTHSTELCALMWRLLTWCNKHQITLRARHVPGSLNVIAEGLRVVLGSSYLHKDLPTLGTATNRPVCHQPEHQTSNLCVSNPGPTGLGGGRAKHLLEEHDRVRIPSDSIATKSGPETTVPTMQAHPNSPRLADKTVVLGPGGTVTRHPETTPTNSLSTQTTTEQPIPHSPGIPQPPHMVSRSTALQNQGFTAEVADRIAAPQRLSTRAIYSSKWSVFERWCIEQQVDFRSPSIKHICEFMCFLFNEKDRRPSTIEGYRPAIADTLGNVPLDISNNTELARLIASFHRDKPKSSRNLPKWDLSIVLHQLKQPPFEPLQEAPLKYVTWKTVFLLALASGKRRSEIHAWTLDGLLCLGEWDQIQLTPSPSFIAKNQLAKEGNQAVSPVVIPALPTPQNDSNEDALLCPVRALSTYLKLTADLRQDKALLFVSYKQGHSKDIQCSTISSWIKNTIKYCYSRVENSDMDLLGVKAHDVRAFAASKAFYGGVSMDQILQACHWKSHNTFTSFYLKDLSGQNQKDLSFHLGSFVAAQQVVTPP